VFSHGRIIGKRAAKICSLETLSFQRSAGFVLCFWAFGSCLPRICSRLFFYQPMQLLRRLDGRSIIAANCGSSICCYIIRLPNYRHVPRLEGLINAR
jgi:hypothetical protein